MKNDWTSYVECCKDLKERDAGKFESSSELNGMTLSVNALVKSVDTRNVSPKVGCPTRIISPLRNFPRISLLDPDLSTELRNASPIDGDFEAPKDVSSMKIGILSTTFDALSLIKAAFSSALSLEHSER
jgi:hypothetical protein